MFTISLQKRNRTISFGWGLASTWIRLDILLLVPPGPPWYERTITSLAVGLAAGHEALDFVSVVRIPDR